MFTEIRKLFFPLQRDLEGEYRYARNMLNNIRETELKVELTGEDLIINERHVPQHHEDLIGTLTERRKDMYMRDNLLTQQINTALQELSSVRQTIMSLDAAIMTAKKEITPATPMQTFASLRKESAKLAGKQIAPQEAAE